MKSKLNDAELIAEAYAKVEVQEEGLGALAGGIGKLAKGAGSLAGKVAKKGLKAAGTVAKEVGKEAAIAAAEVGAEGAKAAGKVAVSAGKAAVGLADKAVDAADKGLSKLAGEDGESETKALEVKVADAEAKGDIDKSDAASIMRMHHNSEDGEQAGHPAGSTELEARNARAHELALAKANAGNEDAEHAAPVEVDMSQNPAPESLEVSKEVEEEPAVAIVAPSIQPSVEEEPRVNHHDDSEVKMALAELYKIEKYAFALGLMMKETKALEGWTAAKITKAADYLGSVFHKLDYDFHAEAEDHADISPEDHEGH